MDGISPIFTAWFVGVVSGFLVQMPVGPINVTIINEGARRGFFWAVMIGMGAAVMELVYCGLGFAGFATFFNSKLVKAAMELISFMLMVFLGLKYLLAHSVATHTKGADRMEERLHPHSAFMIGFVRVLGNPAVLLLWITLASAFAAHEWVADDWASRAACITGVAVGAVAWFFLLSYTVSLKHRQLSTQTLVRMAHISGLCLLGFAGILGIRIILMLAKHHQVIPPAQ
jgi:threonine/homoserine/homoserine lactone efflux protein